MFSVDDVCVGIISHDNIDSVGRFLKCFYLLPELKLNLQKLNLYGVRVDFHTVEHQAEHIGSKACTIPFIYIRKTIIKRFEKVSK